MKKKRECEMKMWKCSFEWKVFQECCHNHMQLSSLSKFDLCTKFILNEYLINAIITISSFLLFPLNDEHVLVHFCSITNNFLFVINCFSTLLPCVIIRLEEWREIMTRSKKMSVNKFKLRWMKGNIFFVEVKRSFRNYVTKFYEKISKKFY